MNHITILSIILVLSGVFGGVVSFFSTKGNEEPINNKELLKSIIIGVK
ncbi:YEATS-associated helix-containing protein [Paenibacillus glacialis]|nr:YEATS-associated helix-containing protein [Paenibacillus glacialis]